MRLALALACLTLNLGWLAPACLGQAPVRPQPVPVVRPSGPRIQPRISPQVRLTSNFFRQATVTGTGFTPSGAVTVNYTYSNGGSPNTHTFGQVGATANGSGGFTTSFALRFRAAFISARATNVTTRQTALASIPPAALRARPARR